MGHEQNSAKVFDSYLEYTSIFHPTKYHCRLTDLTSIYHGYTSKPSGNLILKKIPAYKNLLFITRLKKALILKAIKLLSRCRGSYLKSASCRPFHSLTNMISPINCFGRVPMDLINNLEGKKSNFKSQLKPKMNLITSIQNQLCYPCNKDHLCFIKLKQVLDCRVYNLGKNSLQVLILVGSYMRGFFVLHGVVTFLELFVFKTFITE